DAGAVVRREFSIGRVQLRLVPVSMSDAREKVVADGQAADAGKELKHPHMAVEPDGQLLGEGGEGQGLGTPPQRPDSKREAVTHGFGVSIGESYVTVGNPHAHSASV